MACCHVVAIRPLSAPKAVPSALPRGSRKAWSRQRCLENLPEAIERRFRFQSFLFNATSGTTPGISKRLRPGSISVSGSVSTIVARQRRVRSW